MSSFPLMTQEIALDCTLTQQSWVITQCLWHDLMEGNGPVLNVLTPESLCIFKKAPFQEGLIYFSQNSFCTDTMDT